MNSRQKEILQSQLDGEQEVLKKLQGIYKKALEDVNGHISSLMGRTDTQNLQSIVYQLNYQNALKTQINGILDNLASNQYTTISDYLAKCYENGFVGTMYDLHGQGIPLVFPINQDLVVRAVQNDAPLVEAFYDYLGEDVNLLKKRVRNNISRGMAQGSSYAEIARNIEQGMIGDYSKVRGGALYDAYRIARTEGHRITNAATYDAQTKAKEKGADVVKQWDSTMDRRTRKHHTELDGQLRELDEPFEVAGRKAMYPGGFGVASEDINCRCAILQRARWALDEDELQTLKDRAAYFGLDKTEDFEDFKKKYLAISDNDIYNGSVANAAPNVSYIQSTYGATYAQSVKSSLQNADAEVKAVWNKYQGKFKTSNAKYSGNEAFYSPSSDSVTLNISDAANGSSYQTPYQVLYHEYGHMIDYLAPRESGYGNYTAFTEVFSGLDANGKALFTGTQPGLGETAKNEVKELIKSIKKANAVKTKAEAAQILIDEINQNYSLIARSDVSDMLEGAGIGVAYPLGVGHGKSYWKNRDNGKEIFAEIFSAEIASPDSLACIKKYFPETYKVFRSILGVIK